MGRTTVFIATDNKSLRMGQRLYIDGWWTDEPEPTGWAEWTPEARKWVDERKPLTCVLSDVPTFRSEEGLGRVKDLNFLVFWYARLLGYRYRRRQVVEQIKLREAEEDRRNPGKYRSIFSSGVPLSMSGFSAFKDEFAAKVSWLHVYNPDEGRMGICVDILDDKDARRFILIDRTKSHVKEIGPTFLFVLALVVFKLLVER